MDQDNDADMGSDSESGASNSERGSEGSAEMRDSDSEGSSEGGGMEVEMQVSNREYLLACIGRLTRLECLVLNPDRRLVKDTGDFRPTRCLNGMLDERDVRIRRV